MFPENLLSVVKYHHQPWDATEYSAFPIIIHAANILAHPEEITSDEVLNKDLIKTFFYPKSVKLFEPCRITWDGEVIKEA